MGSPGFCLCAWPGVPASREPQCPAISPLYPAPPTAVRTRWGGRAATPHLPDLTGMSGGLGRRPPEPQRLGCACRTWVQPTAWLCSLRLRARLGRSTEEAFSLCPGSCSVLPSTLRLGRPETRVAPGRPSPGPPAQQSRGGCGHRGSSGPPRVWRKGPASSSLHPSPCPPSLSAECSGNQLHLRLPRAYSPTRTPAGIGTLSSKTHHPLQEPAELTPGPWTCPRALTTAGSPALGPAGPTLSSYSPSRSRLNPEPSPPQAGHTLDPAPQPHRDVSHCQGSQAPPTPTSGKSRWADTALPAATALGGSPGPSARTWASHC